MGLMLGASAEQLQSAEESLELAVYQTAWNSEVIRSRMQKAKEVADAHRDERIRDVNLLRQVASYSDDEKYEDKVFHSGSRQSKKIEEAEGITSPWRSKTNG